MPPLGEAASTLERPCNSTALKHVGVDLRVMFNEEVSKDIVASLLTSGTELETT